MRIVLADRIPEVLEVALKGRSASPPRRTCLIPAVATAEAERWAGRPSPPVSRLLTPGAGSHALRT